MTNTITVQSTKEMKEYAKYLCVLDDDVYAMFYDLEQAKEYSREKLSYGAYVINKETGEKYVA